mmetsp:Transcript_15594/g.30615  ORF Transcript_15594/g.30615 Transcript_15594/m.30615 type:complete len:81 (-) Transcript_15594:1698-1940(-)
MEARPKKNPAKIYPKSLVRDPAKSPKFSVRRASTAEVFQTATGGELEWFDRHVFHFRISEPVKYRYLRLLPKALSSQYFH